MKEKKPCSGPCKGSGFLGCAAPDSGTITAENVMLIKCIRCGGTGFEEEVFRPDDSSYDSNAQKN